jgi:hypothetical protein
MNPLAILADAFKAIPPRFRQPMYVAWAAFGALLGLCAAIDVDHIGPIALAKVVIGYAYFSPVFGFAAAANVARLDKPRKG